MLNDDNDAPIADVIVLERAAADAADHAQLQAAIVGRVVSTGDHFAGFAIIEIVPPDEPALVVEATTLEIV
jgi:hypothetical protein